MTGMYEVSLHKGTPKKNPLLIFSFTQLVGLYIIQPFEIVVPVPLGEMDTANRVVRTLSGKEPEEDTQGGG